MPIILIDSGTTNTRIRLVEKRSNKVIDGIKLQVGVRNTVMDGNNHRLKDEIRNGLQQILDANKLIPKDINYIVAAGMITSNLGIYEVPHIQAPAKIDDFIHNAKVVVNTTFSDIPCIFIPGMKNIGDNMTEDITSVNEYDVMRGEEVETYGLLKQMPQNGMGVMILPGSHTKYVLVDENQKLLSCFSTLGGELLAAVRDRTIISESLNENLIDTLEAVRLIEGYCAAESVGITRSFYHIRLLQLFSNLDENERANYYAGIILHDDIKVLLQMVADKPIEWLIVGGSEPLRSAFVHLLKYVRQAWQIIEATNEQVELAAVYGAYEMGLRYEINNNKIQQVKGEQ